MSPSNQPTFLPSLDPSPRPTLKPTFPLPTLVPTVRPTSEDTISVAVELSMTASSEPTSDNKVTLKATIADELSLDTSAIRNFLVTSEPSSSRRHLSKASAKSVAKSERRVHLLRRLTGSYIWTVSFDIVVPLNSLSDDSVTSASTFESVVAKALDTGLEDALSAAGVEVSVQSVTTSAADDDDNRAAAASAVSWMVHW